MAAVTVITGVHFNRDAVIEMYIAPMDGDRWMVGISQDCTIFGTAGQLRSVAQQILDQVPGGVCTGAVYLVNPDDPAEGNDIVHDEPCPVHVDASESVR